MARLIESVRSPESRRFIRFCVVGASGVLVNLGVFWLTMYALADSSFTSDRRFVVSNGVGFVVSLITNFILNDGWTWRDRRGDSALLRRFIQFAFVASIAGGVQLSVAYVARAWLPTLLGPLGLVRLTETGAVLTGIAVATVINFVANHFWTWGAARADSPK